MIETPVLEPKPKKKRAAAVRKPPKTPSVATATEPGPGKRDDRPPIWKHNPDGTKTRLDHIPNFQGTHPALMVRGDELIRFGYTPEQAIEQIKQEVQAGEIDLGPPKPGRAPSPIPQQSEPNDPEAEQKLEQYLQHHYDYLQAYVRLECGQINGLPLKELEDVASLCVKPVKTFEGWAMTRHGIDYSIKESGEEA